MKDFKGMNKDGLIEECERMEMEIVSLRERLEKKGKGRKSEVLEILKREKESGISIKDIGKELGIKNKNVSSVLSYLREDGYVIWSDNEGRKLFRGIKES